uniref:Uncharacterized protein n=1 Tax=viral metagenome TaxID=1070528 RepID=A0A6C0JWH8_9ZZZZ
MDPTQVFREFAKEVLLCESIEFDVKQVSAEFEEFYGDISKILQRDDSFFSVPRIVFGQDLSLRENRHAAWDHLPGCLIVSFMQGDIRTKVTKVCDMIKNIWNSSGQENDEVTRILNDEASKSKFQDLIDCILNTRLVKIFKNLVETIDISEFDLNVGSAQELIELLKNPQNPRIRSMIEKVQKIIQTKLQKGEINQNEIIAEVETIKAKAMSLFGNMMNDFLGGRTSDVSSAVLRGNTPEARRQRMIARMRRKVDEKNSK